MDAMAMMARKAAAPADVHFHTREKDGLRLAYDDLVSHINHAMSLVRDLQRHISDGWMSSAVRSLHSVAHLLDPYTTHDGKPAKAPLLCIALVKAYRHIFTRAYLFPDADKN
ncbi:hypothetical protein ColTof4_01416 [Colletotrichum tofieldiae]|nr:hypothetical protein ColTof3_08673 [Colletotrichum tofieldiae]GKT68993.1 hypothetical protein ColTof4_01416 [Colletotrichum tofieldiae]GKT96857.1 hypothetical protein Ct61P_14707 [Colletotrichum tofieldiae]